MSLAGFKDYNQRWACSCLLQCSCFAQDERQAHQAIDLEGFADDIFFGSWCK